MMAFPLGEVARVSGLVRSPCTRKVRHATFFEARAHQQSVYTAYGREPYAPLAIYRCRKCDGWHLGRRIVVDAEPPT